VKSIIEVLLNKNIFLALEIKVIYRYLFLYMESTFDSNHYKSE